MADYSKGKIYTIRCKTDPSLIYVGSTIQPLSKRFGGHKTDYNRSESQSHPFYSKVSDWNDWYIELYSSYPCNTVEELRQKEGEIIREIGTLNRCIAGRTKKEYKELNKEHLKECRRNRKDTENESNRLFRQTHNDKTKCECGGHYLNYDRAHHFKTKLHQNYLTACADKLNLS